jgi:hypothetical protein
MERKEVWKRGQFQGSLEFWVETKHATITVILFPSFSFPFFRILFVVFDV